MSPPTFDISPSVELNYPITAYFLPRHTSSCLPHPPKLITCVVTLTQTSWSVDLQHAFPDNIDTDAHFIHVPLSRPPPVCFCGKMCNVVNEEQEEGPWDQYWECTAVCKQRRRYMEYMQERTGDRETQYILFVEGDIFDGDGDVPLLDRVIDPDLEVPMWHRGMVMIKVEGWVPVDVKPVIAAVGGQRIPDTRENELVHLRDFLKTKCKDETAWEARLL